MKKAISILFMALLIISQIVLCNAASRDELIDQCKKYKDDGVYKNDAKSLDKALEICNAAVDADPAHSEGYFWRGVVYTLLGKPDKGLTDFNKVLSIYPNDMQALGNRAAALRALGRFDEALIDANKVIQEDPKSVDAYMTKILVLLLQKDYDGALPVLDTAVALEPKTAASWVLRCAVQFEFQRFKESYADCDRAIKLAPSYAQAYLFRGMNAMRLGNYKVAIDDASKAIQIAPHAAFYNNRAVIYMNMREYENALPDFAKATAMDSTLAEPYFGRGWIYAQQGKVREAIQEYEKFFKVASADNPYRSAAEGSLKALKKMQ